MSKDIEDVVEEFMTKKVHEFLRADGKDTWFDTLAASNWLRSKLQSQADQYEKEKKEMVREMLKQSYHHGGYHDEDNLLVDTEDIKTIAKKYGVNLLE